jgi:hypothetical protein
MAATVSLYLVSHQHHARVELLHLHLLQIDFLIPSEQALPAPQHDRVNQQPVFIDQAPGCQGMGECAATGDPEILTRLLI